MFRDDIVQIVGVILKHSLFIAEIQGVGNRRHRKLCDLLGCTTGKFLIAHLIKAPAMMECPL